MQQFVLLVGLVLVLVGSLTWAGSASLRNNPKAFDPSEYRFTRGLTIAGVAIVLVALSVL